MTPEPAGVVATATARLPSSAVPLSSPYAKGDPAGAEAVAGEALSEGLKVEEIYSEVIAPAMDWIGRLWQHDEASIADEHLATAISQGVMARLFPRLLHGESRSRQTVLLAAAQGEQHVLGLRMMADTLEGAGFDVRYLGADVPIDALLEACRTHQPEGLGLTASMPLTVPTLVLEIQEVAKLDRPPAVFVGGRAVGLSTQSGLDAPVIKSCEEIVDVVTGLFGQQGPQRAIRPTLAARIPPRRQSRANVGAGSERSVAGSFSLTAGAAADTAREAARNAFRFEQLALRDGLTGLWNRRAYDDRLLEMSDEPDGSMLLLDVDNFKSVNDSYGHEAGDEALIAVGNAILRSIRPTDFGARFGGDEFVVLLPGMRALEATDLAERIRAAVETDPRDPPLTVSIGVSDLTDDSRLTSLAVDKALYQAKRAGRNQVANGGG